MSVLDEEDDTTSISRAGYLISEVTSIGKLRYMSAAFSSSLTTVSLGRYLRVGLSSHFGSAGTPTAATKRSDRARVS